MGFCKEKITPDLKALNLIYNATLFVPFSALTIVICKNSSFFDISDSLHPNVTRYSYRENLHYIIDYVIFKNRKAAYTVTKMNNSSTMIIIKKLLSLQFSVLFMDYCNPILEHEKCIHSVHIIMHYLYFHKGNTHTLTNFEMNGFYLAYETTWNNNNNNDSNDGYVDEYSPLYAYLFPSGHL